MNGKPMPASLTNGQQIAQLQGRPLICFGPQHGFKKFGKSGQEICELFPHIGSVADDICIVRSMWTEQINHDPAHTIMNTGSIIPGRPSMGSWVLYGLGAEADDLPGFVVLLSSGRGGQMQPIASRQWSAGLLPSRFQGVKLNSTGDPVLYIKNPHGRRRRTSSAIRSTPSTSSTSSQFDALKDPEIETRVAQYEMAFRMQSQRPRPGGHEQGAEVGSGGCTARSRATAHSPPTACWPGGWPSAACASSSSTTATGTTTRAVKANTALKAEEVDRPTAALINDLKQRGMLDDTLIIWGGEFGRTPMSQGGDGRDHHIKGFSFMMAGGGIKGGITYGATDDFGYAAQDNPVSVHDFHATMLHLLGMDHKRLTVKFQGLDVRLTGISGDVVKDILV